MAWIFNIGSEKCFLSIKRNKLGKIQMYNLNVNQAHVTLKVNCQTRKKKTDSKLCNPGWTGTVYVDQVGPGNKRFAFICFPNVGD